MTNEELCLRAKSGDRDAANRLVENNMAFIYQTALEVLNRETQLNRCLGLEADDLAQEGAVALYRCVERYDPNRGIRFLTYAARAVRNAMYDCMAKQELLLLEDGNDGASDEATSENSEFLSRLKEAICQLTPREQVYLTYRLGLNQGLRKRTRKDAAHHFHLTQSWAKTTEQHALEHLRKILA